MRLFLASQDLGNFPEVLVKLVGEKRRALVISDARDYYQDEERIQNSLTKTFRNLENIGITSKRLDLRQYFKKSEKLVQDIKDYDPGLFFSIGGNVYCLATALHESGMDRIIREGLTKDKFIYGGYSAGSMVATNDISPYEVQKTMSENSDFYNLSDRVKQTYSLSPIMFGLGIIDTYIIPHADREDCAKTIAQRLKNIKKIGGKIILLNDADVYIVNNNKQELMKGAK